MHTLVLGLDYQPLTMLPIAALNWKDAIKALHLGTVRPLEHYEDWVVHSPSIEMRVPSVVVTTAALRIRHTVTFSPQFIFLRDDYTCAYCRRRFPVWKLTLDHVKPKSRGGGRTWQNLVAACMPCNNRRGTNETIRPAYEPYRPTYQTLVAKRRSYPVTIPHVAWVAYLGFADHLISIDPPDRKPDASAERLRSLLLE